jgi:hypothetical protein
MQQNLFLLVGRTLQIGLELGELVIGQVVADLTMMMPMTMRTKMTDGKVGLLEGREVVYQLRIQIDKGEYPGVTRFAIFSDVLLRLVRRL